MPTFADFVKNFLPEEKFVTRTLTYGSDSLTTVERFAAEVPTVKVDPYKPVHTVTAGISKKGNCYVEIDGQRATCSQEAAEHVHQVAKLVNTVLAYR